MTQPETARTEKTRSHSFRDHKNRQWSLAITMGTLLRVQRDCDGLDLMQLIDPESEACRRLANLYDLAACLWVIVEPQAAREGVSPEEFAEGLAGDAIAAAVDALLEGMADFFPDPARRKLMREYWETLRAVDSRLVAAAAAQLDSAQQQLGATSGGGPAPAA